MSCVYKKVLTIKKHYLKSVNNGNITLIQESVNNGDTLRVQEGIFLYIMKLKNTEEKNI